MNLNRFLLYLLSLVIFLFGINFLLQQYELVIGGFDLANAGIVVFAILNIIFYILAAYLSERSDDKNFLNLIMLNFITKFLVVLVIPLVYYEKAKPNSSNFIIPYILIYVVFTAFETWFLNKKIRMR